MSEFISCGGNDIKCPLEKLRFFCSIALSSEDWLESEEFFEEVKLKIGDIDDNT